MSTFSPNDTSPAPTEPRGILLKGKGKPDPSGHLLFIQNLVKRFPGKGGPKTVLDNIDLQVSKGEFITVVGPSGCGKSTLLKLILGAEEPTEGKILLSGEEVGPPDTTRGIVDQETMLFPNRTVLGNMLLPWQLKLSWSEYRARRAELIEQVEHFLEGAQLIEHKDKYPNQLSGGQRARAAIMQGLINNPHILLMDESFGGLDPGTRARMQAFLLDKWVETGKTIFFITHDLEEAVLLGTRVIVLSQYYVDGRGAQAQRGSTILCDHPVGEVGKVVSMKSKLDPSFTANIEHIRQYLLQPDHLWHLEQFDLSHRDSFHTVSEQELKSST